MTASERLKAAQIRLALLEDMPAFVIPSRDIARARNAVDYYQAEVDAEGRASEPDDRRTP